MCLLIGRKQSALSTKYSPFCFEIRVIVSIKTTSSLICTNEQRIRYPSTLSIKLYYDLNRNGKWNPVCIGEMKISSFHIFNKSILYSNINMVFASCDVEPLNYLAYEIKSHITVQNNATTGTKNRGLLWLTSLVRKEILTKWLIFCIISKL